MKHTVTVLTEKAFVLFDLCFREVETKCLLGDRLQNSVGFSRRFRGVSVGFFFVQSGNLSKKHKAKLFLQSCDVILHISHVISTQKESFQKVGTPYHIALLNFAHKVKSHSRSIILNAYDVMSCESEGYS